MALPAIAMSEAWAPYDEVAMGPIFGSSLRRPASERSNEAMKTAASYPMYRSCLDQYPFHTDYITSQMQAMGLNPAIVSMDPSTLAALGNLVAHRIVTDRYADGANQLGDDPRSDGTPYADTTGYQPVNTPDNCTDPDRWQPIPFDDGKGGTFVMDFLTPHWHLVELMRRSPHGISSRCRVTKAIQRLGTLTQRRVLAPPPKAGLNSRKAIGTWSRRALGSPRQIAAERAKLVSDLPPPVRSG